MLAIHDQFSHEVRDRLKTTVMGLGLVRLLQDAGRIAEARATLYSLEHGFQGVSFNQGGAKRRRSYLLFSRSNVTRICSLPGMEANSVGRSFPGGAKHNIRVFSRSS